MARRLFIGYISFHQNGAFVLPNDRQTCPITSQFGFTDCMWLDLDGLHISTTTLVAHPSDDRSDDTAEPDSRLDVLLAVAFGKRLDGARFSRLHAVKALSRNGDQASANIRLAMANLVRIPCADDLAERLAMADGLLAKGLRPKDLLEALGLGSSDFERRYNQNQPRVPAGNGRRSGEFGSGSGSPPIAYTSPGVAGAALTSEGVVTAFEATAEAVALAAPEWSFLSSAVSATALASLAVFAAAVGAAATFGALFVPSPNSVSSRGSLPGTTSHTYDYNQDEGILRVADGAGAIVAAGQKDRNGIFHDADTGVPFARALRRHAPMPKWRRATSRSSAHPQRPRSTISQALVRSHTKSRSII